MTARRRLTRSTCPAISAIERATTLIATYQPSVRPKMRRRARSEYAAYRMSAKPGATAASTGTRSLTRRLLILIAAAVTLLRFHSETEAAGCERQSHERSDRRSARVTFARGTGEEHGACPLALG